jgi:hypothetical protein
MYDGSVLNDIRLFYSKDLNKYTDTEIKSRDAFYQAMESTKTIFFSGKHVQGGFIPQQVKDYEFINGNEIDFIAAIKEYENGKYIFCVCPDGREYHYIKKSENKYIEMISEETSSGISSIEILEGKWYIEED